MNMSSNNTFINNNIGTGMSNKTIYGDKKDQPQPWIID
jgi:hypothetical protein